MNELIVPEFDSYEAEAVFWDTLDTSPFMVDDGEWFKFEVVDLVQDQNRDK